MVYSTRVYITTSVVMKLMNINKFSIKTKIAIPLIVIVFVFSTVTVLNVVKSNQQAAINHELNNVVQPVLDDLEDAYRDIYQVISAAQGLLLAEGDSAAIQYQIGEFKDNAYKAVPRLESIQTLLDQGVLGNESRNEYNKLIQAAKKWISLHEPLFANPADAKQYNADTTPAIDREFAIVREQLRSIRGLIEVKQGALRAQSNASIQSSKLVIEVGIGGIGCNVVIKPIHY